MRQTQPQWVSDFSDCTSLSVVSSLSSVRLLRRLFQYLVNKLLRRCGSLLKQTQVKDQVPVSAVFVRLKFAAVTGLYHPVTK